MAVIPGREGRELASEAADERAYLLQADHAASRDFDKAIITLAAGGLGVSIAFVHDIAQTPQHCRTSAGGSGVADYVGAIGGLTGGAAAVYVVTRSRSTERGKDEANEASAMRSE